MSPTAKTASNIEVLRDVSLTIRCPAKNNPAERERIIEIPRYMSVTGETLCYCEHCSVARMLFLSRRKRVFTKFLIELCS
jgi:hypothetical protein